MSGPVLEMLYYKEHMTEQLHWYVEVPLTSVHIYDENAISEMVVSPRKRAAYFLSQVALRGTVLLMRDISLSITYGKYLY